MCALHEDNNNEEPMVIDDDDEEVDIFLVSSLTEVFPDACPQYLRNICKGKTNENGILDDLITKILDEDSYPKREVASQEPLNYDQQLDIMKNILPEADPTYLQQNCGKLINKPDELKMFINNALETNNYPKLNDFLRKQRISSQKKQYTSEFCVKKFLEVIPDPIQYFQNSNRLIHGDNQYVIHYALSYLRNKFNMFSVVMIRGQFTKNKFNFLKTCYDLEKFPPVRKMRTKRLPRPMPEPIDDIPLLQEIAFYDHQTEIIQYLKEKEEKCKREMNEAKVAGLLSTCTCCYDDEIMPNEVFYCENGCLFCKNCIKRSVEITFGDGKLDFMCLNNCSCQFSLQVLQAVLTPKLFSSIALKKQVEEVKAAGIEDLESCPFCDFVTIPAPDDKLFHCLNAECMKQSCRQCKEPAHVPLRCDEVEKDYDVKNRVYVENKMTEALLRTCYKCGLKFIKAEGCNKMTCSCGALMCYICGKPVRDYKHFNGQGGDNINLCPLYSDTNKLHREAILKGAEEAKSEIGVNLKIDPTVGVEDQYRSQQTQMAEHHFINLFDAMHPVRARLQHLVDMIGVDVNMMMDRNLL